jgi:hypothetical protein
VAIGHDQRVLIIEPEWIHARTIDEVVLVVVPLPGKPRGALRDELGIRRASDDWRSDPIGGRMVETKLEPAELEDALVEGARIDSSIGDEEARQRCPAKLLAQ